MYCSSIPCGFGKAVQQAEALMITINEYGRERSSVKPAEPILFAGGVVPHKAEVAADDHVVIFGQSSGVEAAFREFCDVV